ncbi:sensor domain-containing diguanylate cyclase [uncultured Pseudokineococcus sp.]|uniref:sensor domain-containing diguanylate cyclase n=1 Tax=uncultured Pseudokineococcus sp. TaxID=1642928 RepID=UPI00260E9851|nr:sensor domain-containing diguanylate cyclase [uncultured Pseudokineococcus sp.]
MGRRAGSSGPAEVVDVDRRDDAVRTALLALLYGALAAALRAHPSLLEIAWPAGGVAALWLASSWGRPARLLRDGALVVAVTVVAYVAVDASVARGAAVGVCALMAALVTVVVLQHLSGGRPRLRRPADLAAALGAAVVGGLVPALVGPSLVQAADGEDLPLVVWGWLLRAAVSTFVVLVVGLRLEAALGGLRRRRADAAAPGRRAGSSPAAGVPSAGGPARPGQLLEAGAVVVLLLGAYATGTWLHDVTPLALMLLPLAVWAALRLPTTWTALLVLANATAVVLLTDAGLGPAQPLPPGVAVTAAQVLVGVVSVVVMVVALHRDAVDEATARERAARERAQEQADLLAGVLVNAHDGVVVVDPAGRVLLDNAAARELLGLHPDATRRAQDGSFTLLHADGTLVEEAHMPLVRALLGKTTTGQHLVVRRHDGTERTVVVSARPLPGTTGRHGAVATLHDVTRERYAVTALAESERLFRQVLDSSPLGMLVLPLDPGPRRVLRTNPALVRLLARTDLEGEDVSAVTDPTDLPLLASALDAMADGVEVSRLELRLLGPGGRRLRCACAASVVQRGDGRREAVLLVEDVTARHEAERALSHQARHDALTGLPNRVVLGERLSALVGGGVRAEARVGVLYLDLDGFKDVNDAEGHAVGDAVLGEVARRLSAAVRPGDTVARLGGDEFVVVCPDLSGEHDLGLVAQRVVDALGRPFDPPARHHRITASAGAALAGHGDDATTLLERADSAMYEAKRAGGDRWSSAAPAPRRVDQRGGEGDARALAPAPATPLLTPEEPPTSPS